MGASGEASCAHQCFGPGRRGCYNGMDTGRPLQHAGTTTLPSSGKDDSFCNGAHFSDSRSVT